MQRTVQKGALLAGAIATALVILMGTPTAAFARPRPGEGARQKAHRLTHRIAHKPHITHATVAVTYTGESARQASVDNNRFWLNGGSIDAAIAFYRGLGVAAALTAVHAGNFTPGVDIGKTTIAFGPRYTWQVSDWAQKGKWLEKENWLKKIPRSQLFAETLFGVAHGFDGQFPEGSTIAPSANSFAFQLGAGLDVAVWRHLGARAIELDYIHTGLPNGAGSSQNSVRLSFGVTYRWDVPTPSALKPATKPRLP